MVLIQCVKDNVTAQPFIPRDPIIAIHVVEHENLLDGVDEGRPALKFSEAMGKLMLQRFNRFAEPLDAFSKFVALVPWNSASLSVLADSKIHSPSDVVVRVIHDERAGKVWLWIRNTEYDSEWLRTHNGSLLVCFLKIPITGLHLKHAMTRTLY